MADFQLLNVAYKKWGLTIGLSLLLAIGASAQPAKVHYPQGVFEFNARFSDNETTLKLMDAFIRSTSDHTSQQIQRIRITGFSSIEGPYTTNERLARDRAVHFHHFLIDRHPELSKTPVDLAWVGEDWVSFTRLIRESQINERAEVLRIINGISSFDERERLLRQLNGGQAYRAMETLIFPSLRRVEVIIECSPNTDQPDQPAKHNADSPTADNPAIVGNDKTGTTTSTETDATTDATTDTTPYVTPGHTTPGHTTLAQSVNDARRTFEESEYLPKPVKTTKHYRIAIKTNLPQWAGIDADWQTGAPLINGAVEYFFTPRWSAEVGGMYTYRKRDGGRQFRGISGYRAEVRHYLPLIEYRFDLFLGAYGRMGDYDQRHEEPNINHTGDYWDAGLSAGLAFRVAGSWWIEAGARAGYVATDAIRYTKDGAYNWYETTVPFSEVRFTELNVSIAYRFFAF